MDVYKFGGASVSSAQTIENLVEIVKSHSGPLVIVVSAFGKTTNLLEDILASWYNNDNMRFDLLGKLKDYHYEIIDKLFSGTNNPVYSAADDNLGVLHNMISGDPSDDYDFQYDQFVSMGEILSSTIIYRYLELKGVNNIWRDARQWLVTDSNYREAQVDFDATYNNTKECFDFSGSEIYITQGFIGGTYEGSVTTLGREGSDFTASILGNLLNAKKVIVWKDVPGIMTADPLFFPEAEKLSELTYQEAIELAFYGAKVIHPRTIKPLQNKGIPLYVNSFYNPDAIGTLIHESITSEKSKPIIIVKSNQLLISLIPRDFSFVLEDYMSRIFAMFFKYRMKINLIQHSAVSISLCIDNSSRFIGNLTGEMKNDFKVLYNNELSLITVRHFDEMTINKQISGREVLVEQRSRSTAMYVVR